MDKAIKHFENVGTLIGAALVPHRGPLAGPANFRKRMYSHSFLWVDFPSSFDSDWLSGFA